MLTLLLACAGTENPPKDDVESTTDDTGVTETDTTDSGTPETTPSTFDPDDLDRVRSRVERDLANAYATGASVAIWKDGAIVFAEGFGSADPDANVPVTPDTLFQIGSDTKKLTALAALQLVADGTLDLSAPIATILPDFSLADAPGWAESLTLHHLLSHQGGSVDWTPWEDLPADDQLHGQADGTFSEGGYVMAPPGALWNYSNPNFSLAALLAETASGKPWADLMYDEVFGPLGMDDTWAREADIPNDALVALGYGVVFEGERNWFDLWGAEGAPQYHVGTASLEDTVDNAFTQPAGGTPWSTASDVCRSAGFLIDGNPAVLDDGLRQQMSAIQVEMYPGYPIPYGYGYGLFAQQGYWDLDRAYRDVPLVFHGGNTLAYTSTFILLPEQRFAICILSNGYGDDFWPTAQKAMDLLAGLPDASTEPDLSGRDPDLAALAGTYYDHGVGEILITLEGDALGIEIPWLSSIGLTVAPTLVHAFNETFTVAIAGTAYDLTFIDGKDGTPATYVRNRLFVGTRVE